MNQALAELGASPTPQSKGRMLEYFADIQKAAGHPAEEKDALRQALDLYTAKEFELGRSRVAQRLSSLG